MDPLVRTDQVVLYDYTPRAIRLLQDCGFAIVVVSNQSAIARGMVSEEDVERANTHLQELLRVASGGEIERFYVCPHHPEATVPAYRVVCDCRKPKPGMLLRAARELDLDLDSSYMIGDRLSDVIAGKEAGCRTILVKTGMHTAQPTGPNGSAEPDYVCDNLAQAAEIILQRATKRL